MPHKDPAARAAYDREYRERNREALAAHKREYRERNREARAAYKREYYERNPVIAKNRSRRRRDVYREIAAAARRSGEPWTPAEDAVARDPNLSIIEAAYALSRTPSAVRRRRWGTAEDAVARDPK